MARIGRKTGRGGPGSDPRLRTPLIAVDVGGEELGLYLHDGGVLWIAGGSGAEGWTGASDLARIATFLLAATGGAHAEGDELSLFLKGGETLLTLRDAVVGVEIAFDDPAAPRLEGFVGLEEMARVVSAGISMVDPAYSLLDLELGDIKKSALRLRHAAVHRELRARAGDDP